MCTHYGAVFAGCASSLGWVARSIVVDHHCLAEVWCEELQKWILEDAGPAREFDATYEIDGVPINALELHEAAADERREKIMANKLPQKVVEPMANYIDVFCRFGIPLRNTHLIFAEPAELRHGAGQYHWDGYLWWSDDVDPRLRRILLADLPRRGFLLVGQPDAALPPSGGKGAYAASRSRAHRTQLLALLRCAKTAARGARSATLALNGRSPRAKTCSKRGRSTSSASRAASPRCASKRRNVSASLSLATPPCAVSSGMAALPSSSSASCWHSTRSCRSRTWAILNGCSP